jgi:hypothetical protein
MTSISAVCTTAFQRISILVLLTGAASGCGGSPTQPNWDGQVRVSGTISDFQTNAAIGGAHVTIGNATVTTDANGFYFLTVPSGDEQITIDGESIGLVTMPYPTYRGDFYLHVSDCVARYGTVVDRQTRRPISSASVSVAGLTVATDYSGWFRLNLGCPPANVLKIGTMLCVGFNTTFLSVTHPSYQDGSFVAGRGVCLVERVDYELAPR